MPVELPVAARRDLEHLAAEHGLGLDRGLGAVTQLDAVPNGEVHQHLRPLELDAGTPCRRDSPDTRTSLPGLMPPASEK